MTTSNSSRRRAQDPTQLEFSFMAEAPPPSVREPGASKAQQHNKLIEALKLLRQHPRFIEFMEGD